MPTAEAGRWKSRVEAELERLLAPGPAVPERLNRAMRHAVLDGGKRLRALLVFATGHAFGAEEHSLDAVAASVELLHAYSLVHDDLPAMDDDRLRRGKPTVHVAYGEATAILAGDALQALAFEALVLAPLAAEARLALLSTLSGAAGARGMCGGQQLDMEAGGGASRGLAGPDRQALLQRLHAMKTGALITASVRMGAIAAGADEANLRGLDEFAADLGLAFQVRDDLLDVEADARQLGKSAGKDIAQDKLTYPAVLGMDATRTLLASLQDRMAASLGGMGGQMGPLAALARYAVARTL